MKDESEPELKVEPIRRGPSSVSTVLSKHLRSCAATFSRGEKG